MGLELRRIFFSSIGIEITDEPRNVEYKLRSYPFTYRLIISERDEYEEKDSLIIIGYKRFHTLTDIIGEIPDFDSWIKKKSNDTIFEEVNRRCDSLFIYGSGNVTKHICYLPLFPLLVDLGLASRDTKEITGPKTFMVSLTHDGWQSMS
ncbi:MAG TPA: hypothetical protein EYH04_01300 [Archaeoglobus profundus]|nr:hypothetical protein [Archaeoglobus profundus]